MKTALLVCAVGLFGWNVAQADLSERDQAMALSKAGDQKGAIAVFVKMAAGTKNETNKSECLLEAARCAVKMKDFPVATELAGQIPSVPYATFCTMEILRGKAQREQLVAVTEKEDFSAWPEKLIYPALLIRGEAYLSLGRTAEAEADFAEAAEQTMSLQQKGRAMLYQAEVMARQGKSPEELLAFYGRIMELVPKGGGILPRARLARARLFAGAGQEKLAIDEIVAVETLGGKEPYWIAATNLAYGEVFEAAGKPLDAAGRYQNVITFADSPEEIKVQAQERLEKLQASQKTISK